MAERELPSPDLLRQLLDYDPETGDFTWKSKTISTIETEGKHSAARICKAWNRVWAGRPAFTTIGNHGYKSGHIRYRAVLAHRVAYAYFYGEWPKGLIDHINGDRLDNRISNLRCVDDTDNARNQALQVKNTSGVCGVARARGERWRAYITVNGKQKSLGEFTDFSQAVAARKEAERKLGFHLNHGQIRVRSDQSPPVLSPM